MNLFEHLDELVFSNVFAGELFGIERPAFAPLWTGQLVPTAVPGHPETVTYWMLDDAGLFEQVTHDQAFVQSLWLHYAFGLPVVDGTESPALSALGLADLDYRIDFTGMHDTIQGMPDFIAMMAANGFNEEVVWQYAMHTAPNVTVAELVGLDPNTDQP